MLNLITTQEDTFTFQLVITENKRHQSRDHFKVHLKDQLTH